MVTFPPFSEENTHTPKHWSALGYDESDNLFIYSCDVTFLYKQNTADWLSKHHKQSSLIKLGYI